MKRKLMVATAVIAAALATTGLVASSGTAAKSQQVRVALVTDIGGLNDKGFNTLANAGLKKAKAKLGANLETRSTSRTRTPTARRTSSGRRRTATSS